MAEGLEPASRVEFVREWMACEIIDSFLCPEKLGRQAEIFVCCVERNTGESSEDD